MMINKRVVRRTEAVRRTGSAMKKALIAAITVIAVTQPVLAASIVNRDTEPQVIVVTEGSSRTELTLGAGETAQFCPNGCFVTMPNGDRQALIGPEMIEITDGKAVFR